MLLDNEIKISIFDIYIDGQIVLTLNELMENVIPAQVDIELGLEMLKIQAIIVRTNILRRLKINGGQRCYEHPECDFCNSGHCIDFISHTEMKNKWKERYESNINLVKEAILYTDGLVIKYNNKLIDARFNYTCGGGTENSENVISNKVVYLRRVLCDYCKDSPSYKTSKNISIKEIQNKLGVFMPTNGEVEINMDGFIEKIDKDETGRVKSVVIGGKKFSGLEIAKTLGIKSTRFSLIPSQIIIQTSGEGDGLGLCQFGAFNMLKQGHTLQEVLKYYYTGVDIVQIKKRDDNKPLVSKVIVLDPAHGGEDQDDYVNEDGIKENEVVLNISKQLKKHLEEKGATVFCTRDKDEFITLNQRAVCCNEIRPDFFISIHTNHSKNETLKGCRIYHYRNDIDSRILGELILDELCKNIQIIAKGVKAADLYLLREVGVSAIHMEVGYLSNKQEASKLVNQRFVNKYVEAITNALIKFFVN